MKSSVSVAEATAVRILKIGSCPTLSGKSTLTYHVGCIEGTDVRFRVFGNSGGGFYSNEWVSANDLHGVLKRSSIVTAATLLPCFRGRSANNGGFLLSVLKNEGLIVRSTESSRSYVAVESPAFVAELQELIAAGADLDPNKKPGKKTFAVKGSATARKTAKSVAK